MADGASVNVATTAQAVLHPTRPSGEALAYAQSAGAGADAPDLEVTGPEVTATDATAAGAGSASEARGASPAAPIMLSPATPAPAAPARARRRGGMFSALCALLSLAGAGVALTAPTLRPQAFDLARIWLGDDSPALRYLASPASDMAQSMAVPPGYPAASVPSSASPGGAASVQVASLAAVRAELIATLRLELDTVRRAAAEQADRLKSVGASVQSVQGEAVSARGDARAATGAAAAAASAAARAQADAARAQEAAARALDGTRDRFDRLDAQVATFDARVRATGLVVTAGQLRRDIEAGAPLSDDLVAIGSSGPVPAPVQQALDQLSRAERGVPTSRDLAVGFETLDADIAAHRGGQGSWTSLGGLFGSGSSQRESLDRVRVLATEGRFSEVADMLERSDWAELSKRWIAQVRLHSDAAIAGQLIMAHALAAYEASQTAPPSWPQGTSSTGRLSQ